MVYIQNEQSIVVHLLLRYAQLYISTDSNWLTEYQNPTEAEF